MQPGDGEGVDDFDEDDIIEIDDESDAEKDQRKGDDREIRLVVWREVSNVWATRMVLMSVRRASPRHS